MADAQILAAAREIRERWEEIDAEAGQQGAIEQSIEADAFALEQSIAAILRRHNELPISRCEHDVADGDWCEECDKEYHRERKENEVEDAE